MSISHFIDHTILKNTTSLADVEKACREAIEYDFYSVCLPPYYVPDAKEILHGSKIKVTTVIGFPFGYSHYKSKYIEAEEAINNGADELDMVINLAAFKNNDIAYLETEITNISKLTERKDKILKLIIETGILSENEIIRCCELYKHYPINFLKTSTGYADRGASIEAVQIMKKHLPSSIQIKASGGIKSYEFAIQLIKAGASRLGCSSSIHIVNGNIDLHENY